jgi:hypothetical protein
MQGDATDGSGASDGDGEPHKLAENGLGHVPSGFLLRPVSRSAGCGAEA